MNTAILEFSQFACDHGLILTVDRIVADGKLHRVKVEGDSGSKKSGSYSLHEHANGFFAGCVINFKNGQDKAITWASKHVTSLTDAERKALAAQKKEQERLALAETQARYAEAAKRCSEDYAKALNGMPVPSKSSYVARKGIVPYAAAWWGGDSKVLLVPIYKKAGQIASLQMISEDGGKKFRSGGEIRGCYLPIKGYRFDEAMENRPCLADAILICEGYATGCSLFFATGIPVFVAFSAANLKTLAVRLRQSRPSIQLIIAGDNDPSGLGRNKAIEAAEAVGGLAVWPEFGEVLGGKGVPNKTVPNPTDFNDLHQLGGAESVRGQIKAAYEKMQASQRQPEPEPEPEAQPQPVVVVESAAATRQIKLTYQQIKVCSLIHKSLSSAKEQMAIAQELAADYCIEMPDLLQKEALGDAWSTVTQFLLANGVPQNMVSDLVQPANAL